MCTRERHSTTRAWAYLILLESSRKSSAPTHIIIFCERPLGMAVYSEMLDGFVLCFVVFNSELYGVSNSVDTKLCT